jgi:hypothetical protein
LATLAVAALQFICTTARADQSGTPFWTSGQFASLAAVPPSPGWSLNLAGYGYDGSAGGSAQLPIGRMIVAHANQRSPSLSVQPGYAPEATVLGGQPFIGLSFGTGGNRLQGDVTSAPAGVQISRTDTLSAGTDLYPFSSLGWTRGNDNWMVYLTGDIPTGAYQAPRFANIGIGHAAIDGGGGYTYYDAKTGLEFSAVAGLTYNWENTQTNYKNGVDSHLDWSASRFIGTNWNLGVAGYLYYQLTGDSGSGAVLGPFKSRVAGIGPEIGCQFTVARAQWSANLRAYGEFGARNRYEGYALFATLNIPLTSAQ